MRRQDAVRAVWRAGRRHRSIGHPGAQSGERVEGCAGRCVCIFDICGGAFLREAVFVGASRLGVWNLSLCEDIALRPSFLLCYCVLLRVACVLA
jgi:hypothetical protein